MERGYFRNRSCDFWRRYIGCCWNMFSLFHRHLAGTVVCIADSSSSRLVLWFYLTLCAEQDNDRQDVKLRREGSRECNLNTVGIVMLFRGYKEVLHMLAADWAVMFKDPVQMLSVIILWSFVNTYVLLMTGVFLPMLLLMLFPMILVLRDKKFLMSITEARNKRLAHVFVFSVYNVLYSNICPQPNKMQVSRIFVKPLLPRVF